MSHAGSHYFLLGGASGVAKAVARRLHEAGATLTLAGRDSDRLVAVAEPCGARVAIVDGTDFDAVDGAVAQAAAEAGRLDGVVNCAGSLLLKPAHLTTAAEWRATIDANLTTAFATVRAAGKALRKSGGAVVRVSSAAAEVGLTSHEAIAAAKAGVAGLVRSAAATYAASNLRVNAVAPGLTRTPLTERIWSNEASAAASLAMHAIGRLGEPDDVASLIVWLLDPANSWITGQVIGVDGGLGRVRPALRR